MNEYKEFALHIAQQAGAIIKKNFSMGMNRTIKSDNTPVTETDLKVNALLLDGVRKNFPGHNVLAEEESDISHSSEYVWVCDPVDGTIPFSHGIPICAFSLALVKNGESILGVIYDPLQDRMFFAEKGKGAYLNDQKISVSKTETFKGEVADCESYNAGLFDLSKFAPYVKMNKGLRTLKLSSFVYSSALVAAGELVFAILPGKYAHDVAAVKIIVEEAGGRVTNILGEEQRYDQDIRGAIASNGVLHDEIVKICKEVVTTLQN